MAKKFNPAITQDQAWAVAAAAYRINGGYFKVIDEGRRPNTELIYELMDNPEQITAEDQAQGQVIRSYIAKTATMATLRGTLDSWGQEMARVSQLEAIEDSFSLHVIASMPQTHARYLQREQVHQRLSETATAQNVQLKDRLELDVEVLTSQYSTKWSTYYVTVVDQHNRAWYFAHGRRLAPGLKCTIRGTVKRFADRMIQLNRVSIVEEQTA